MIQFGLGGALGLGGGWLLWKVINRFQLDEGLYAILALSGGLMIYALSNMLGGSGILSIYLVGLLLGNKATRGKHAILNVLDGMTWLSQIGMFLVLGLLLTPSQLGDIWLPALVLAFGMILFARPIAVWVSLLPFSSFSKRDRWFLSWVGLRGAVPIILAVFPMMAGLEHAQLYFNLAFFVVMVSLLVQGSSLTTAAKLAKVELPPKPMPISRTGLEIFPKSEWQLFVYCLSEHKWCVGEPLSRLTMPEGTRITAVFRQQQLVNPKGTTVLESGDYLCVLGQEHNLDDLSQLFSQAPQTEEEARFFGDFFVDVSAKLAELALMYGIELDADEQQLNLAQLVQQQLGEAQCVGDQFYWHGLDWIVCDIDEGKAAKVGIRLPPEPEPEAT